MLISFGLRHFEDQPVAVIYAGLIPTPEQHPRIRSNPYTISLDATPRVRLAGLGLPGVGPGMEWGDAPAWAVLVLSAGAFVVSIKARQDGRRSADASAKSADAAVRSADAAEATLADQRRAAEEERRARLEAEQPRPDVRVEYVSGDTWALRNTGSAPAVAVTVGERDWPPGTERPVGWELACGEARPFMMAGDMAHPVPAQLWLAWSGQREPVARRVPPRAPRIRKR